MFKKVAAFWKERRKRKIMEDLEYGVFCFLTSGDFTQTEKDEALRRLFTLLKPKLINGFNQENTDGTD